MNYFLAYYVLGVKTSLLVDEGFELPPEPKITLAQLRSGNSNWLNFYLTRCLYSSNERQCNFNNFSAWLSSKSLPLWSNSAEIALFLNHSLNHVND